MRRFQGEKHALIRPGLIAEGYLLAMECVNHILGLGHTAKTGRFCPGDVAASWQAWLRAALTRLERQFQPVTGNAATKATMPEEPRHFFVQRVVALD